jgi:Concanavalin A-like lectin/glucanases superfamily
VALIPRSGGGNNDFRATTKAATGDPEETPIIGSVTPLSLNQRHHVVLTFDMFDVTAGANGTAKLYLNNTAPVAAEIRPFLDLMTDNNNWLGRSPWGGDALFDGLIDELRIHDTALSAAQVASSFTTGPEAALLPVLVVNRDTGAISIKNESGSNIQLKGYSVTSTGGALNPLTWTSIDADNTFDPNGLWTAQSSTAFNLSESNTGQTLDGGTLTANASRSIGSPWRETPIEDLAFNFTLGDNSVGSGLVQYTGSAALRSDFNGDGNINVADWALFVPNSFTLLTGQSKVAAYLKGDLDGDLDNDYQDFQLFKADYIEANGLSAFNSLMAVPEPNSVILISLASAMLISFRRN